MMITCRECLKEFAGRGDDPRVRGGRYHLSSCDYCPKLDVERDEELAEPAVIRQEIVHRHSDMSRQDFARLQNLIGQVKYLQNKIDDITKRREPDTKHSYKGIKGK